MPETEVIPEDEIPKAKKERKKKIMTPEMLSQLKLAREKALIVKKALKESDEAKITHAKDKIKKERAKPKKKEVIKKLAEEELKKEDLEAVEKNKA